MKPSDYSLTAVIRAVMAETWGRVPSEERREHERLCRLAGSEPGGLGAAKIPGHALRDLTVAGSGGYLAGDTVTGDYIRALANDSAALRLGCRIVPVPAATAVFALPAASSGATAYWAQDEATQITDSAPLIGSHAATPKLLGAYVELSRLLLLQAPNAEQVVREELRRAAAAELDAAIFAGSGVDGQPQGIVGAPNTGTFTGGTLATAALRAAQSDIAAAITNPAAVALATTPAVAELLATRARASGTDRMIWEGSSFDGIAEGVRAISTAAMPAATAIMGDWSSCWIAEFGGGLTLEVDPFTQFQAGIVGLRLLMGADTLLARPGAFTVAESVT